MAKLTLTDIASGYLSLAKYNANNTLIEAALENTLSRDGTSPNTMSVSLDLNSNKLVNVLDATNNQDAVTLAQLNAAAVGGATGPATGITIADAGGYYVATTVEAALQEVFTILASSSNGDGASLIGVEDPAADFTATDVEGVLTELQANIDALGFITNVVEDTTPQLGGALDCNSNPINMGDQVLSRPVLKDFGITSTSPTSSSNAMTIDLALGNAFQHTLTENTTVTLSNPPASGTFGECIIKFVQDSSTRTVTWPASVIWPGNTAPVISTASGDIDIVTLKTWDGGTTWFGNFSQDYD